jgi:hypothetical protein
LLLKRLALLRLLLQQLRLLLLHLLNLELRHLGLLLVFARRLALRMDSPNSAVKVGCYACLPGWLYSPCSVAKHS